MFPLTFLLTLSQHSDGVDDGRVVFILMFLSPLGERLGEGALNPDKVRFS